ncbi:MAG: cache domain-containing protein, partial [Pyrinomonadaceae bacterium]
MSLRGKLLLVFICFGVAPVLLVCLWLWQWGGARAAEDAVRANAEQGARHFESEVEAALAGHETELQALARSRAVGDLVRKAAASGSATGGAASGVATAAAPDGVADAVGLLLASERDAYASISIIAADAPSRTLLRAEPPAPGTSQPPRFQTGNFLPGQVRADGRVWGLSESQPLRTLISDESSYGVGVTYTVPVFSGDGGGGLSAPAGAVVAEVKLGPLFRQVGKDVTAFAVPAQTGVLSGGEETEESRPTRLAVALDQSGRIVYHTNEALLYQSAGASMPHFGAVAHEMAAGAAGERFFNAPPEGDRWLVAYRPAPGLGLSLAVAINHTAATAVA